MENQNNFENYREATQEEVDAMFDAWMAGNAGLFKISKTGVTAIKMPTKEANEK